MGSNRLQLIGQFLSETFLITLIAVVISIVLTPVILKLFADFISKDIKMDILGHRGMLGNQSYPVSATAIEESEVCFITTDFFNTTLMVNHELAYQMVLFYADELQQAELGMRNMVHMNVKSRIADALLKLQDNFGTDGDGFINCSITRQDIASYAGTTYETLFKTLHELTEEKIVETSGKTIRIQHQDKLKDLTMLPQNKISAAIGHRDLQSTG